VQAINLRGLRNIRTAIKTGQRSRPQAKGGVFNELAHLEQEKIRLTVEKGNWDEKLRLLEDRLAEIARIEESLGLADGAPDLRATAQRRRAAGRIDDDDSERFEEVTVRY